MGEDERLGRRRDGQAHHRRGAGAGAGTRLTGTNGRPKGLVIQDNHRMLHAAEGCHARYKRRRIRSAIKGDYGLGCFEDGKKSGEVFWEVA